MNKRSGLPARALATRNRVALHIRWIEWFENSFDTLGTGVEEFEDDF